jgi:hypothetical protein
MTRASQTHELKTWPEYFAAVRVGLKDFEVRRWDRDFAVGDVLKLREYDPDTATYSGAYLTAVVTYVLDYPVFKHSDVEAAPMTRCAVMGIRRVKL